MKYAFTGKSATLGSGHITPPTAGYSSVTPQLDVFNSHIT